MRELADILTKPSATAPATLRWGVVTAVVTGPPKTVTAQLSGSSTPTAGIRYLSSYTPTVADVVAMLVTGTDVLVLGRLA